MILADGKQAAHSRDGCGARVTYGGVSVTKSLTYLAISNRESYVAITKCGTIHLNWQGQQIHLHPHRFQRLARLLETSMKQAYANNLRDGGISLTRGDGGDYHLTVGAFSLHIASDHLSKLVQMVEEASHWYPTLPVANTQAGIESA
jgi:hypothetical protein